MELTETTVQDAAAGKPVVRSAGVYAERNARINDRLSRFGAKLNDRWDVVDAESGVEIPSDDLANYLGVTGCPYCALGIADIHAATAAARAARGR